MSVELKLLQLLEIKTMQPVIAMPESKITPATRGECAVHTAIHTMLLRKVSIAGQLQSDILEKGFVSFYVEERFLRQTEIH